MPKYKPWMKSAHWLRVLRFLPCSHCGVVGRTDAHHVGTRGMGLKNPDSMCIPLCRRCHRSHHSQNKPTTDWCREKLAEFWSILAKMTEGHDPYEVANGIAEAGFIEGGYDAEPNRRVVADRSRKEQS